MAERIVTVAGELVDAVNRRLGLRGATLVDLACGTGNAALIAAARGAEVTGVDVTPELIAIAERRARETGHAVTWVTADAADTALPAESFDAAISNMGIIFVDPQRQVPELRRLLKPEGLLGFSSWVRNDSNPFFDPIVEVLGAPPRAGFSPDQWGDPALAAQRLADDFTDVQSATGSFAWEFPSVEDAMRFMLDESPMHVDVLRRVDPDQRARLESAFRAALTAHADDDGVRFHAPYVVVTATRHR